MAAPLRWIGQGAAYAVFMGVVGVFSTAPSWSPLPADRALLRVSFSHAGDRVEPCKRFTPEEIARMAPNMRRAQNCARERVALRLQVTVNGELLMDRELAPAGLHGDGAAAVYASFPLSPGAADIEARLRDSRRQEGFDHEAAFQIEIAPGESRVLSFRAQDGGFRVL